MIAFGLLLLGVVSAEKHCVGKCQLGDENAKMPITMKIKLDNFEINHLLGTSPKRVPSVANQPCVNGYAGEYECNEVDLLSFTNLNDLGCGGEGNDIWGWTDPVTGHEYAIMGCYDGTSFVDVTDPINPIVVGYLMSHLGRGSVWRDIKVYKDHAFVISEASSHGMQVFDLTNLRVSNNMTATSRPHTFVPDEHYEEFGSCHNIVINEATGFAYGVGSRTCRAGPHIIDIHDPKNPRFVGCFDNDGYTHDAECVVYHGPDTAYQGRELCFLYNEDSLVIIDVEDKNNIRQLSKVIYHGVAYSHQGWLTEDQQYLLLDDELDEMQQLNDGYTQTRIWDVRDLSNPFVMDSYYSPVRSVDHNMYIRGNYVYQANYESGLRILDISDIANANLKEVGVFDCRPEGTAVQFNGAWSVYPYFESKNLILSSIERGLFVLKFSGLK